MITAYPVKGKTKSAYICQAFAEGCGGQVATDAKTLADGPCFFYGVDGSNLHLWKQAVKDLHRDYYYADNSYFDGLREVHFRVTKNRLQHTGSGESDGRRFRATGVKIRPWRKAGEHIVVCPQSDHFMHSVLGMRGSWLRQMIHDLRAATKRQLRVREWAPNKGMLCASLGRDLDGAHALVTYSSAAAVTALLGGIPVVSNGAAALLATDLENIETPYLPDDRERWAGVLADNEWTMDEMRSGEAWRMLNI